MNFMEALDALEKGEKVIREGWEEAEGYLSLMPRMKHVWKVLTQPNPNAGNNLFSVEDYRANDWKVL